jgi:hypothetical protein
LSRRKPKGLLFQSSCARLARQKLFTYSAVGSASERRYILLTSPTGTEGLLTTQGQIHMTKANAKPSAGRSSTATQRPAAKSAANPAVPGRPAVKAVAKPPTKASQPAQPMPAAKQPVVARRSTPWTVEAARRDYRTSATENGGQVPKGSLAAQAMSKATKGAPPPKSRSK